MDLKKKKNCIFFFFIRPEKPGKVMEKMTCNFEVDYFKLLSIISEYLDNI